MVEPSSQSLEAREKSPLSEVRFFYFFIFLFFDHENNNDDDYDDDDDVWVLDLILDFGAMSCDYHYYDNRDY